jgi:hypothetical protein
MTDKRALKILCDAYWTGDEWRTSPVVTAEDFAYARGRGVMFEPVLIEHDEVISRLVGACRGINVTDLANMFLASLCSRRPELRSALGSYAVFRHLGPHSGQFEQHVCVICGLAKPRGRPEDLNVLNFERFKWGGVRHDQPVYAALDLELFLREQPLAPQAKDIELFHAILKAIQKVPPETTAAEVQAKLPRSLKSNKAERNVILAILGFCGILSSSGHPDYRERFVPPPERSLPHRRFVDMPYPACWWRGTDGVNVNAVKEFFGHVV